jgi:hypothetical protein
MKSLQRVVLIILACTVGLPSGGIGQPTQASVRASLGLRIGYPFFVNDWNKVRYLPDVNLFKGQFTFGGDLEFPITDRLGLAIDGGYQPLDGGDWETYASARGDTLSVNASFGYVGIVLKPHIWTEGPDALQVEVGPVMLFRSGNETLNGVRFTYDFFNSVKYGGEGGIEYDRKFSEGIAASLRFAGIVVPSGIEYADGETRTVIALPITLGVRFYF